MKRHNRHSCEAILKGTEWPYLMLHWRECYLHQMMDRINDIGTLTSEIAIWNRRLQIADER